ncbi:MAG TPA: DUF5985 family protein [Terriglobales bacterium]|nr:DUF5985 family protein [Terriglobales bacterium]
MKQLLLGSIGMASLIAALFFARFWQASHDRFYFFFTASFLIQGIDRFALGLYASASEEQPLFYLVRLIAYLLIIVAIADKNRAKL